MEIHEAAQVLGMKKREVLSVQDSPAGPVIETFDGCAYIVVPDDLPDAAGRTGLMLFRAPSANGSWAMPVYEQPGAADTEVEPAPDDDGPTEAAETGEAQVSDTEPVDTEVDPAPAKGKGRGNR